MVSLGFTGPGDGPPPRPREQVTLVDLTTLPELEKATPTPRPPERDAQSRPTDTSARTTQPDERTDKSEEILTRPENPVTSDPAPDLVAEKPQDPQPPDDPPVVKKVEREAPWLLNNKLRLDEDVVAPEDARLLADQAATTRNVGENRPDQMGAGVMDRPELPQPFMTHVAMDGGEKLGEVKDLDALRSDRDMKNPEEEMAASRFASPLQAQRRELMSQDTQRPTVARPGASAPASPPVARVAAVPLKPPPAPGGAVPPPPPSPSLDPARPSPPVSPADNSAETKPAENLAKDPREPEAQRELTRSQAAPSPRVDAPAAPSPATPARALPPPPAPAVAAQRATQASPEVLTKEAPLLPDEGVPLAELSRPLPPSRASQATPARAAQKGPVKSDGTYTSQATELSFYVEEESPRPPEPEKVALLTPESRVDKRAKDIRPARETPTGSEAKPSTVTPEAKPEETAVKPVPEPPEPREEEKNQPPTRAEGPGSPSVIPPAPEPPREEVKVVPPAAPTQVATTNSTATPPRAVRSGGSEVPRPQEGEGGQDHQGRSAPNVSDEVLRNLSAQSGLPVSTLREMGVADVDATSSPYYRYYTDVYRQAQRSLDKYLKQNPYFGVELGAASTDVVVVINRDGKITALTVSRRSGTALDTVAQDTIRKCRFGAFPDGGYPDYLVIRIRVRNPQG